MSWQKCPICDGKGEVVSAGDNLDVCPTCEGLRIIGDTGRPPSKPINQTQTTDKALSDEEILNPKDLLNDMTDEEILYYATPYYDELQARKAAHEESLNTQNDLEGTHGNH